MAIPLDQQKVCATCKREFKTESDFLNGTSRWRKCASGHLWFNCACDSTLMLKKDKHPWYSTEKQLDEDAFTFFNKFTNLKNLPLLETHVFSLQQQLQDTNSSVQQLVKSLKTAPLIATELLSTANNIKDVRNQTGSKIQSIEHAIVYVGRRTLAELTLTASLKSFDVETEVFDKETFWRESIQVAMISEYLAKGLAPNLDQDHAYLAGAVCNIGKWVSAICFPEATDEICRILERENNPLDWPSAEKDHHDHSTLGEVAAAIWGLPSFALGAIKNHHVSSAILSKLDHPDIDAIVGIANQVRHWVCLEPYRVDLKIFDAFEKKIGYSPKQMSQLASRIQSLLQHSSLL